MVLIDYDALLDGHATAPDGQRRTAETHRGTPLPVETIRRIACDAGIIPIVLGGDGQALDVGRERRLATRAQRMALRAQYPTCAMDPAHAPRSRCRASHHREGTTLTERAVGADQRTRQRRPLTMTRPPHEGGWTLTRNQRRHLADAPTPETTPMTASKPGVRHPTCSRALPHIPSPRGSGTHHREGTVLAERAVGADQRTRQRHPFPIAHAPANETAPSLPDRPRTSERDSAIPSR